MAAPLRFAACRSRMQPAQVSARALQQLHRHAQPEVAPAVPSPRLFFHGGLMRRQDLPPVMVLPSRVLSSGTFESPNKNPPPSCTKPAADVEALANNQEPMTCHKKQSPWEIKKQIEEKKEELLQLLLLQMDAEQTPSISERSLAEHNEQLLHLLREFQANTKRSEMPELERVMSFVRGIGLTYCVVVLLSLLRSGP